MRHPIDSRPDRRRRYCAKSAVRVFHIDDIRAVPFGDFCLFDAGHAREHESHSEDSHARRQEVSVDEPIEGARPGFVGIAPHVDALTQDDMSGFGITHNNIHVENEVRHLLDPPRHRIPRPQFTREFGVATAARSQISGVGAIGNTRNIMFAAACAGANYRR
jgi:hypothetical protein